MSDNGKESGGGGLKNFFELYMACEAKIARIKAQLVSTEVEQQEIIRRILERRGIGVKMVYSHPTLGNVIPIERKRPDGTSTFYFRQVKPKVVSVG